jgi:uncharacterized phage infection (PIP) family protein YhgE
VGLRAPQAKQECVDNATASTATASTEEEEEREEAAAVKMMEVSVAVAAAERLRSEHDAAESWAVHLREQANQMSAAAERLRADSEAAQAAAERLRVKREAADRAVEQLRAEQAAAAVAAQRLKVQLEEAAYHQLRLQQVRARLDTSGGVPPSPAASAPSPASQADEELCVVCVDARKDRLMLPCGHLCACEPCAAKLMRVRPARCPICREGIREVIRVYS